MQPIPGLHSVSIYQIAAKRRKTRSLRGWTMLEIGVVLAIMAILALLSVPRVDAYLTEGKVPKVADDLRRFMARSRINAAASADPNSAFQTANQRAFALAVAGSTAMSANTSTYVVSHNLGSGGVVRFTSADGGRGYNLSLDKVSQVACPMLPGLLARDSNKISVNGQELKNTETPVNFNANSAEAACLDGDENTLVFTVGNYEIAAGSK